MCMCDSCTEKCKPGHPPSIKNRKQSVSLAPSPVALKRRPGRPRGTKNLPPANDVPPKKTITVSLNCNQVRKTLSTRKKTTAMKRLELSITICIAGSDVSPTIFPSVQNFLETDCEAGIFAVERGITDAVQREGMLLSTFYGAADLKNRVEVNPSNIMQRALQYNKFVSHHPLGTSFHGCIRRMLVGGHYTPSTSWLINKGMDLTRMASLWKCYVEPGTLTMADVKNIFFWLPRQYPSRFVEGVHPGLQILKASVLEDLCDSDHSPFQAERLSGNPAAHDITKFASFIPLVPGNTSIVTFHRYSVICSCHFHYPGIPGSDAFVLVTQVLKRCNQIVAIGHSKELAVTAYVVRPEENIVQNVHRL
ncbi:hypothetical protein R1sor_025544 [Riccia sorocarpa]|uniref:Uncharacterized protein n=1 Tax=Riccia sorocarpa TaxID=122646 RepID=A0ABD3GCL2_9MARC